MHTHTHTHTHTHLEYLTQIVFHWNNCCPTSSQY